MGILYRNLDRGILYRNLDRVNTPMGITPTGIRQECIATRDLWMSMR